MKKTEIEILSENVNCPVVHMTGRRFPGVIIQGDSLKILLGLSDDIVSSLNESPAEELKATAKQLHGVLSGYVGIYESTMRNCGRQLPYPPNK